MQPFLAAFLFTNTPLGQIVRNYQKERKKECVAGSNRHASF